MEFRRRGAAAGAGATRIFWCQSLSGLFCSVGRAAGFSGPGAERLDDYRLGWILVSSLRFGSTALRVRESVGCGVDPSHGHVAGPSRNVKGIFFLTKSALRAAVASCAVGELEFGLITKYYCTARRNSPLLQKASTFTGPQLWPADDFQPLIFGNSALLVFRCDCRESPHQLPLPALFLRL